MKRLIVLPLALALAACSSTYSDSDTPETYEPYYEVRDHGTIQADPPETQGLQFAAFCRNEQRFVSSWSSGQGSAESSAGDHRSKMEWHEVIVIWRQPRIPEGIRIGVPNSAAHEDLTDDIPVRPRQSVTKKRGY